MAKAFSRTTRALGEDLRLWPTAFGFIALFLAVTWWGWFTTANLPVYVESRDVVVEAGERSLSRFVGQGVDGRLETVRLPVVTVGFSDRDRSSVLPGQPAILRIHGPDGRIDAVSGVVEPQWRDDGRVLIRIEDAESVLLPLPQGAQEIWVETGRQSPFSLVLEGAGHGVETRALTGGPTAP